VRAFTIPLRHRQHDDGSLPARVSSAAPLPVLSCACTSAPPGRRRRLETPSPSRVASRCRRQAAREARVGSARNPRSPPGPTGTELPAGPRCPPGGARGPRCGTCLAGWRLGRPTGKLVNHRPVAGRDCGQASHAWQPGSTSGRATAAAVPVASMANPTQAGEDNGRLPRRLGAEVAARWQ